MQPTETSLSVSQSSAGRRQGATDSRRTGAAQCRVQTPLGPMTALATEAGLAGLWFDGQKHHPGELHAPVEPGHPHLRAVEQWLESYWAAQGQIRALLRLPAPPRLDLRGTPFQRAVWSALRAIPPGSTSTYAVIAKAAGSPAGVRAAGAVIGRNPVSLLVPCHRVLGRDGSLTGYAGGLERKRALLANEGALSP